MEEVSTAQKYDQYLAPLAALLFVLALSIFLATMTWSLGCDEPQTANIVQYSPSWGDLLQHVADDCNPPLIYVVLKAWTSIFGVTDGAFKACVILIAAAIPASIFLALHKEFGRLAAAQIALCTMFCASFVHHGQLVRSYGLLILLGFLASAALRRLLQHPGRKQAIVYALLLAAVPYTHLSGMVLCAGHVIGFAWLTVRKKVQASAMRLALAAYAGALVLLSPQILLNWHTLIAPQLQPNIGLAHQPLSVLLKGVPPSTLLIGLPRLALAAGDSANSAWLVAGFAVIFWGALLFVIFRRARVRSRFPSMHYGFWLSTLIGMILAEVIVATQILRETYLVLFIVPLLMVIVIACDTVLRSMPRVLAAGAPLLILLALWSPELLDIVQHRDSGVKEMCEQVNLSAKAHPHCFLLVSRAWYGPAVDRYLNAAIAWGCFPSGRPVKILDYAHGLPLGDDAAMKEWDGFVAQQLLQNEIVFHLYPRARLKAPTRPESVGGEFDRREEMVGLETQQFLNKHARLFSTQETNDCSGTLILSAYKPAPFAGPASR